MSLSFASPTVELEIPGKAEFVGLARLLVVTLAHGRRAIADDRVDDLKLAVSEATTNAIESYGPGGEGRVLVRWEEGPSHLAVSVADGGKGFDLDHLPPHPPVTDAKRLNFERGLGIPLIRSLVDEVTFSSSDKGTVVRMVVFCDSAGDDDEEDLDLPGDLDDDVELD